MSIKSDYDDTADRLSELAAQIEDMRAILNAHFPGCEIERVSASCGFYARAIPTTTARVHTDNRTVTITLKGSW